MEVGVEVCYLDVLYWNGDMRLKIDDKLHYGGLESYLDQYISMYKKFQFVVIMRYTDYADVSSASEYELSNYLNTVCGYEAVFCTDHKIINRTDPDVILGDYEWLLQHGTEAYCYVPN